MARLPGTISLIRRGGTFTALASAVCDRAMGFRNSSIRIPPGWGFGSRSVIVDDLDLVGMAISPDEADPPLVIDADRVRADVVSSQRFDPIGWRHPHAVRGAEVPAHRLSHHCAHVRRAPE